MKSKLFAIILSMLFILSACAPQTHVDKALTTQTIKIGVVAPMSGDAAFLGEATRNGLQMAIDEMRSTKYKYELIAEDDRLDPKQTTTGAQKLINIDQVNAFVTLSSGTGNAAARVATDNQVIHFGIASDANIAKSKYNFLHWTPPAEEARVFANEAQKQGVKKVAVLILNHQGANAIYNEAKKRLVEKNIEIVAEHYFNTGERDFKTLITKARQAKPDTYFILAFTPEVEVLKKQMDELNIKETITTIEAFDLTEQQELFEGLWYVGSSQESDEFVRNYKQKFDIDPKLGAPNAYDVGLMLIHAFEMAGDGKTIPTQDQVISQLSKIKDFDASLGSLTVGESGIVWSPAIVKVIKDGKAQPLHASTQEKSNTKQSPTKTLDPNKPSIKIGWIGPLSGGAAEYGETELNAARLALEDVNAKGGINGAKMELIVEDGKCDGKAATNAANKLLTVDKVTYIMGGHCSTESLTIQPIIEQHKAFMLAGATSSGDFSNKAKYAFRTTPSGDEMYGFIGEHAYKNGHRAMVTFVELKDFPQSLAKSVEKTFKQNGGEVILSEKFAQGSTDFRTDILKIKNLNPDVLVLSAQSTQSAGQLVKQLMQQGFEGQIYGGPIVISKSTWEHSGKLLPETAIGALPYVDIDRTPETRAFVKRYLAEHGEMGLDLFTATEGYDAIFILKDLIEHCDEDIDCARDRILSTTYPGITTDFKFSESGDPNPYIGMVRIVDGEPVYN